MSNSYEVVDQGVLIALQSGDKTLIDAIDLPQVSQYSWSAQKNYNSKNHERIYVCGGPNGNLHRFLLQPPKGLYVDHINHDTLDNRRENLRIVTHQENDSNRDGAYNTSQSGIRGVSPHTTNNHDKKKYWTFRCHLQQCKASKFFPYTPEGLEEARVFSDKHYTAMLTGDPIPTVAREPTTGVKGISIMKHKGLPYRYHARCIVSGKHCSAIFPYSPEGLQNAKTQLEQWKNYSNA